MSLIALLLAHLAGAADVPPNVAPGPTAVQEAEAGDEIPPAPEQAEQAEQAPEWEGSLTLGSNLSRGNTDVTKASATGDATWENERKRWTLGFTWNYSEEDGTISQRKTFGRAQFDRFVTDRFYWLAQTSGEGDKEADLDLRTTLGAGVGYQFYDQENWKLSSELGLTRFNEDLVGAGAEDHVALRVAAKWEWIPGETWTLSQSAEIFPSVEDGDDVYSKLDTRLKAAVTGSLFAQLQWVWDWDNTPAVGAERSDHLYLLTIGWSF